MSLQMPITMRFFKISAILGTLIIILTVAYAWMRIQQFEQNVYVVFEKMVTENLEAESLKDELQHIEKVLRVAAENKTVTNVEIDGVEYTSYEIERLRNDRQHISGYVQEKNALLAKYTSVKKHIMNEVRVLFVVSLAFLVAGTLLAVLGYLGWYYRIEMFEERRRQTR